jgi:DNA-binding NarL/FixJ family response regulator
MLRANIRKLLGRTTDILVIGEASDGGEAVELVNQLKPDLLLLDMEMPVMTGPEVAATLRSSGTSTRILALSAYNDREYIMAMLDQGASGYLTKDEAPNNIIDAIRSVMNGQQVWVNK